MATSGRRLAGKVTIVTGVGQGIGGAIAAAYALEAVRVVFTDRTMRKLAEVAEKIVGER